MDRTTWIAQGIAGLALLTLAACITPISHAQKRPYIADVISCPDDRITRQGPVLDVCGYQFTAACEWKGLYFGTKCDLMLTPEQREHNELFVAQDLFVKDTSCDLGASTGTPDSDGARILGGDAYVARMKGCGHYIRYRCSTRPGVYELPRCTRLEYDEENKIEAYSAATTKFAAQTGCGTSIRPMNGYPQYEQDTDRIEVVLEGCDQARAFTCPRIDPEQGTGASCTDVTPTEKRVADEDQATAALFATATGCVADKPTIATLMTSWDTYMSARMTYKRASGCGAVMDFHCEERHLGDTAIQCSHLDSFKRNELRVQAHNQFIAETGCRESKTRLILRAVNNRDVHLTYDGCLHNVSDLTCVYDPVADTATCAPDKPMRALRSAAVAAITENFSRAMSCPAREIKVVSQETTPEILRYEARGCNHNAEYECPNHPGQPAACVTPTEPSAPTPNGRSNPRPFEVDMH